MSSVDQLTEWIDSGNSIVALTGAGISTASGIPDFRSAAGIYSDKNNANVFDLDVFQRDPSIFYTFARTFYPQIRDAAPNSAHRALAAMKQVTVVTQNIDDYHQRAGSDPVYTVHGNYIQSTCLGCGGRVGTQTLFPIIENGKIPYCICGGVYKPNITFFGEMLPAYDWNASEQAVSKADLVLVLGTSLSVYPVATLPGYRPWNAKLVIINREPTPLDAEAQLVLHGDICETLEAIFC